MDTMKAETQPGQAKTKKELLRKTYINFWLIQVVRQNF